MTDFLHYFEGGTDGATLTTANSGTAPDAAFNTVTGGSIWTFSSTGKIRGTLGARVVIGTTATAWRAYDQWSAVTQVVGRVGFTWNGTVKASTVICGVINSSFAAMMKVVTDATGKVIVQNAAGTTLATTAAALTAGTAYYVEMQVAAGATGTTDGTINVQLYTAAAPGTLLINFTSTAANTNGTAGSVRGQLGDNSAVASLDITFDDVMWRTSTLTPLGAPSGNLPPVAAIDNAVTVSPWTAVTHSGSTSNDPDGTIAAYAWTQTAGTTVTLTGAATSTVSYTAPAVYGGTSVTLQLTVTDNSGATNSATVADTIKAPNEVAPVGGVLVPVRIQAATT